MAAQKGIGRLIQFGIAKESSRGTPETAATYYVPVSEVSLDEKKTKVLDETSVGVIESSVSSVIAKEWAEGSVKFPIGDKTFPLILFSLFGTNTDTTHAGESVVYDHTMAVAQSAQHQALSLFVDDPLGAQDYKFGNGMVTSLELKYEAGKYIEATVGFKSKKGATATLTPALTAENRFLAHHLTFKMASALSGLTAASATVLKGATIKFEPNVEDDDVLGSTAPADFLNRAFKVTGTIEALWKNESDFRTAFNANTMQALRFDLINTDVTIGSTANPELRIDFAKVTFMELTRPVAVNDLVKQTVAFTAHYSTGDSKMLAVVATNGVATY